MKYTDCKLHGIKRKKDLTKLINYKTKLIDKYNIMYKPYIGKPKERLVEAPNFYLKSLQKKIKILLDELEYPANVYCGIKDRSYIDNGKYHLNSDYVLKMDLSAFFPNISREKIYQFYLKKLNMSADVAKIMTNLSSVNLKTITNKKIDDYMQRKKIKYYNHLPTGSPISSILSYLVNQDMFIKINQYAIDNDLKVSFYVDDIVFSSNEAINDEVKTKIMKIANEFGVSINKKKTKYYGKNDFKKITGCIIKGGKLFIPNKLKYKIKKLSENERYIKSNYHKIIGIINSMQLFDKTKYVALKSKIISKYKS